MEIARPWACVVQPPAWGHARVFLTATPPESSEFSGAPLCAEWGARSRPAIGIKIAAVMLAKRRQITRAWTVRLIIVSRWQLTHYGAGPERLTLFQIKIYNANTHLPARAGDAELLSDSRLGAPLWLWSRERS